MRGRSRTARRRVEARPHEASIGGAEQGIARMGKSIRSPGDFLNERRPLSEFARVGEELRADSERPIQLLKFL